ncbi:MAG: aminopeptidase [Candidatus Aenigmarchaeota archaeon]|nr:aminopeptidase [Candidatus Aenigmarchaeota archaeon]
MLSEKEMRRIARTIVNVNLGIEEKDVTVISAGPKSLKLAEALALEASRIGAQPTIFYGSDELSLKTYRVIKTKFLRNLPKLADALSKLADVEIRIDETDPFIARQLPQKKVEIRRKAVKPIREREERRQFKKEMKAVLLGFPTPETARAMKIPFNKLNKIFWDAMKIDYQKLYEYNAKIIRKLANANEIRITGERTDLKFSVKGREFINSCGIIAKEKMGYINLPEGEVFCPPVENSANGEIYFDLPCMWHYGKQVEGVWFKFKKGRVVDYEIEKGEKNFEDVMRNASGDRDRIAEFGIGTNPAAKITGGMIIVDEKVLSTIHLAIGRNKHFGGSNDSTIHWDFLKDMRHGEIYADKKLIMKNGLIV